MYIYEPVLENISLIIPDHRDNILSNTGVNILQTKPKINCHSEQH